MTQVEEEKEKESGVTFSLPFTYSLIFSLSLSTSLSFLLFVVSAHHRANYSGKEFARNAIATPDSYKLRTKKYRRKIVTLSMKVTQVCVYVFNGQK